ncbi:hypothetical protein [Streptomyces xanthophaeus]|uniref:hypothetical protein n=1 Tax=Streptomyces xanthophaeus TaxID=67385 RepID=UPI0004CD0293|nr:hypothetical protein [Streptomyces xanthophaeus]
MAWLHIVAPGHGVIPTVRSSCSCGRDLFAAGHRKALALITDDEHHRSACPQLNPTQGKAA